MNVFVIWIDPNDSELGREHEVSHPHLLRIYSEVDELNHSFRVQNETTLGHVFDEFYHRTGTPRGPMDRMKCEANGEDLLAHSALTFDHMKSSGECRELVWVFTNRPVHVFIDTRPTEVNHKEISFDAIVSLAYDGNPPSGPTWNFTVDYSHGPRGSRGGALNKGETVVLKDGMQFNVSGTNES